MQAKKQLLGPEVRRLPLQEAAQRHLDFSLGIFANPIFGDGDYPQSVRERVGTNLPAFTEEQRSLLTGSADYFALNHYTSKYVAQSKEPFSLEGGQAAIYTYLKRDSIC